MTSFDDSLSSLRPFRRIAFRLSETMEGLKRAIPGTPFYNSLLRLKDSKVFDQITLRIEEPAGNAAPVVVISYVDMFGNPTVGPQAMAGVGSAANVLYGVAPDGIAAANPNGTSALFTIAPFNLQVHH